MRSHTLVLILVVAVLAGCGDDDDANGAATDPSGGFDSARAFADLEAQVAFGPRPAGSPANRRLTRFLARRLRQAGTRSVRIQKPYRNVVGTIPGAKPGIVVVGAHHDTKNRIPGFEGANDGASGVAVVLELARSLPRRLPGPSVQFVLFDAEEARGSRPFDLDGARGSRQYVEIAEAGGGQGAPAVNQIRAMVLFDLVGDCDLQIPREINSDQGLYRDFAGAATQLSGSPAPFEGETTPIADDHVPFLEAGIRAVDLIDFSYGPGPSPGQYWHTPLDTLDKVCPESLEAVGEAALVAIPAIR